MSTELAQAYAVTVAPFLPGELLAGRYRLEEVVGIGAYSTVYRALDERLTVADTPAHVAIKVSREPMAAFEFKRVQRIDHPGVVALRDRGVHEGLHFLVSDYVAGEDLATAASDSPRATARLIAAVCRGVAAAHARGVSHGDLKPANILMDSHGPVVADFGGGRTATYAPPEGGEATPAGDIWSLGVILGELAVDPPGGLRRIIRAAQHPDPQRRPSASQLADWLEAWVERRPPPYEKVSPARRLCLWVVRSPYQFATVVLALLIAFGAGAGWQLMNVEAQRRADAQTAAEVDELKTALRSTAIGWYRALSAIRTFLAEGQAAEAAAAAASTPTNPDPADASEPAEPVKAPIP